MGEYMSTAELAELCRTSESTVRYWRHRGEGPQGFRVGRKVLYPRAEVNRWLEELASKDAAAQGAA